MLSSFRQSFKLCPSFLEPCRGVRKPQPEENKRFTDLWEVPFTAERPGQGSPPTFLLKWMEGKKEKNPIRAKQSGGFRTDTRARVHTHTLTITVGWCFFFNLISTWFKVRQAAFTSDWTSVLVCFMPQRRVCLQALQLRLLSVSRGRDLSKCRPLNPASATSFALFYKFESSNFVKNMWILWYFMVAAFLTGSLLYHKKMFHIRVNISWNQSWFHLMQKLNFSLLLPAILFSRWHNT